MARKRMTNVEAVTRYLERRGYASHKEIVKHLLRRDGLSYTDETRRRYDKLFYGSEAPLRHVTVHLSRSWFPRPTFELGR